MTSSARIYSLLLIVVAGCGLLLSGQQVRSGPWVMETSGTAAGLRGIHAVGGGVAWASGTNGTVLRTEDGGYLWQMCAIPQGAEKLDFRGIWAWDANTAIIMSSGTGDQSRIYKTTDGCAHWKQVFNSDPGGFFDALLFLDRQHGIVLGDPSFEKSGPGAGYIFRMIVTSDGGADWIPVTDPELNHQGRNLQPLPNEAFYAASNSSITANGDWLWLGTNHARALRRRVRVNGKVVGFLPSGCAGQLEPTTFSCGLPWTDWQSAQTPIFHGTASSGIFSLAFRDMSHGVAVGGDYKKPDDSGGTAAWTSDGGKHWTAATKSPHGFRSAVAWDGGAKAWITAGTNGSDVSYDDGKTWIPLDNGNWNALSLPWVVGPHGRIAKLDESKLPKR
jgi:photosystem II stability/assembly factor-like uncharacterized protein